MEGYREYEVEVFYHDCPQYVVTITDSSPEAAERRACLSIFMMALRDGREWKLDDIAASVMA